jgi:hypothetical protein
VGAILGRIFDQWEALSARDIVGLTDRVYLVAERRRVHEAYQA